MYLELIGHNEVHLLQSLALLFFPVSSFENKKEDVTDGRWVKSELIRDAAALKVRTEISDGELTVTRECAQAEGSGAEAIARCFYDAAVQLTGIHPKWGTITGIRPAKLVKSLMDAGLNETETTAALLQRFYTQPEKTTLCFDVLNCEKPALELLQPQSVSLYVSIPFCPSRCSYCSFVSHSIEKAGKLIPTYLDLLCRELFLLSELVKRQQLIVSTIYIGGGTPTVLDAAQLERLMRSIAENFTLDTVKEYTVEAGRPDTVTAEKLKVIHRYGAERVSINPQTLSDKTLEEIGRRHNTADFARAFTLARNEGFGVINTDLIAGLPGEEVHDFRSSLDGILSLSAENITVHTLSIKKSSQIRKSGSFGENAGKIEEMLSYAASALKAENYLPYYLYRQKNTLGNFENVGYAKPGRAGLYNIYIMGEYQTILAAGAGAVSKVVSHGGEKIERIFNYKYPYEYINNFSKTEDNIKNAEQLLQEAAKDKDR